MDDHSALNQIKLLKQLSIVSSQLDIELLLLHLLEIDRNTLYRDNPPLTVEIRNKLKELTQRREKGEPLAYRFHDFSRFSSNSASERLP